MASPVECSIPPAIEECLMQQLLFWRVKWVLKHVPMRVRTEKTTQKGATPAVGSDATPSKDTPDTEPTDADANLASDADAGFVTSEIIKKAMTNEALKDILLAKSQYLVGEVRLALKQVREVQLYEWKSACHRQASPELDTLEVLSVSDSASDDERGDDEGEQEKGIILEDVLHYCILLHVGHSVLASRCCGEILRTHSTAQLEELLGDAHFSQTLQAILKRLSAKEGEVVPDLVVNTKFKKEFQLNVRSASNLRVFLALKAQEQRRILHQDSTTVVCALLEMAMIDPPLPLAQLIYLVKLSRECANPDERAASAIGVAQKHLDTLKANGKGSVSNATNNGGQWHANGASASEWSTPKGWKGKKGVGKVASSAKHDSHFSQVRQNFGQSCNHCTSNGHATDFGVQANGQTKVVQPLKEGRDMSTQVHFDDLVENAPAVPTPITILQRPKTNESAQTGGWQAYIAPQKLRHQQSPIQTVTEVATSTPVWPKAQQKKQAPTSAPEWPSLNQEAGGRKARWSGETLRRAWADEIEEDVEQLEVQKKTALQKEDYLEAARCRRLIDERKLDVARETGEAKSFSANANLRSVIRMVFVVQAPGDSVTFKPDHAFVSRRDALARICASALYLQQGLHNPVCAELICIFEDGLSLRFGQNFVKSNPSPSERSVVEGMQKVARSGRSEIASFDDVCRQYASANTFGLLLHESYSDAITDFVQRRKVPTPPPASYTFIVLLGSVKDVETRMLHEFCTELRSHKIPILKASIGSVAEFTSKIIDLVHGYIAYDLFLPRIMALRTNTVKGHRQEFTKQRVQQWRPPPLRAVLGSVGLEGHAAAYHVVRAMIAHLWRSRGAYEENSLSFVGDKVFTVHGTVVKNLNSQHKAAPCERNVLGFLRQAVNGKKGDLRVDAGVVDTEMPRGVLVVEVELGSAEAPLLDCESVSPAQAGGSIIVVLHTSTVRAPYSFKNLPDGILISRVRLPRISHHAALSLLNLYNQHNVLWPALVRLATRKTEKET